MSAVLKVKVMALPVLLVSVRVTVYWIDTGPVSLPCTVALRLAVTASSSVRFAVAVAVEMVTLPLEGLLMVASTVSVPSSKRSSSTVTESVPVAEPSVTLMVPPLTAV